MQLDAIKINVSQGLYEKALEQLQNIEAGQRLEGKIIKSQILYRLGHFAESYNLASEAMLTSQKEGRRIEEASSRLSRAHSLMRMSQYEQLIAEIYEGKPLLNITNPRDYQKIRGIEAEFLNLEGLYYRYTGQFNKALEYYFQSLEIKSKLNLQSQMGLSLTNIGTVYQIQGELDKALKYHLEALELTSEKGSELFQAFALQDIAEIYWERGEIEPAETYLLRALITRQSILHYPDTCRTFFVLLRFYLEFENLELAQESFDKIKQIHKKHKNIKSINIYFDLANATMLKQSNRIIKRAEAQKIFQTYHNREDIDFQYRKYAMLNLCDLLITDLKLSKNEEVLQEVQSISEKLEKFAKEQYSTPLLVETYFLRSKLALIKLDLETAQYLLTQAEMTAQEMDLNHTAQKISMEHDSMIDKLGRWDQLKRYNATLLERVEAADIEKTITELITKRQREVLDNSEEVPQFLLVLNEDAVTLYSDTFTSEIEINEQLIGGFLMATNFSINEALDSRGSIERIKYGKYNLIFMKYLQITFCYAFEGQSYYAVQRLNGFIDRIKLSRVWDLLSAKAPQPYKIKADMQTKVDAYFQNQTLFST